MSFFNPINRLVLIDQLIRKCETGPPKDLAKKIGISERALYEDLGHLKDDLGCPIEYCRNMQSYHYTTDGGAIFGFKDIHNDDIRGN